MGFLLRRNCLIKKQLWRQIISCIWWLSVVSLIINWVASYKIEIH